jgi:hypothetical protein
MNCDQITLSDGALNVDFRVRKLFVSVGHASFQRFRIAGKVCVVVPEAWTNQGIGFVEPSGRSVLQKGDGRVSIVRNCHVNSSKQFPPESD